MNRQLSFSSQAIPLAPIGNAHPRGSITSTQGRSSDSRKLHPRTPYTPLKIMNSMVQEFPIPKPLEDLIIEQTRFLYILSNLPQALNAVPEHLVTAAEISASNMAETRNKLENLQSEMALLEHHRTIYAIKSTNTKWYQIQKKRYINKVKKELSSILKSKQDSFRALEQSAHVDLTHARLNLQYIIKVCISTGGFSPEVAASILAPTNGRNRPSPEGLLPSYSFIETSQSGIKARYKIIPKSGLPLEAAPPSYEQALESPPAYDPEETSQL